MKFILQPAPARQLLFFLFQDNLIINKNCNSNLNFIIIKDQVNLNEINQENKYYFYSEILTLKCGL